MLIGVTGYAQHGKDTAANLLVAEAGFKRAAFADALKEMALVLDPYVLARSFEELEAGLSQGTHRLSAFVRELGWEGAKQNPEVRRFLQVLGTEAVRGIMGPDAWVNILAERARPDFAAGQNIVVPDVRFPNEAQFIQRGGFLLGVRRVNDDGSPFDNGVGTSHPSEANVGKLLEQADLVVTASDVAGLEAEVREAFFTFFSRQWEESQEAIG